MKKREKRACNDPFRTDMGSKWTRKMSPDPMADRAGALNGSFTPCPRILVSFISVRTKTLISYSSLSLSLAADLEAFAEPPLMAASVAAVLRSGAHIFSGNSCSSQIRSARTFSVCFSSSSKRKEKRSGKGSMVALVPSIDHVHPGKTARRTLLMPSHSFQRSFRASSKVESATGPSTAADDTVSSSIPEADSAASSVSSSAAPSMDSIRDVAVADSPVPTVSSSATPSADSIRDAADTLDIRVGRILKAWRHPEADSLYVEEVDIGEPEPRTICSGLVKYIPLDDLQEANVVVLANLKPRNMRGIKSNGMLLAASDSSHENVELLVPPEGSILGERIWFGAEDEKNNTAAASPNQIQKKKIWELVQPHLKTDDSCVGFLGEHPMRTSTGVVTCKSLQNGNIA